MQREDARQAFYAGGAALMNALLTELRAKLPEEALTVIADLNAEIFKMMLGDDGS